MLGFLRGYKKKTSTTNIKDPKRQSQTFVKPNDYMNAVNPGQGFSSIFDHALLNQNNRIVVDEAARGDLGPGTGPLSEVETEKLRMSNATNEKGGIGNPVGQSGFSFGSH